MEYKKQKCINHYSNTGESIRSLLLRKSKKNLTEQEKFDLWFLKKFNLLFKIKTLEDKNFLKTLYNDLSKPIENLPHNEFRQLSAFCDIRNKAIIYSQKSFNLERTAHKSRKYYLINCKIGDEFIGQSKIDKKSWDKFREVFLHTIIKKNHFRIAPSANGNRIKFFFLALEHLHSPLDDHKIISIVSFLLGSDKECISILKSEDNMEMLYSIINKQKLDENSLPNAITHHKVSYEVVEDVSTYVNSALMEIVSGNDYIDYIDRPACNQ